MKVVFIGGTGRCGTSIIRDFLGTLDGFLSLDFEYRFLIDPNGVLETYNNLKVIQSPFSQDFHIRKFANFLSRLGGSDCNLLKSNGSRLQSIINFGEAYRGWELEQVFPNYRVRFQELLEGMGIESYCGTWHGHITDGEPIIYLGEESNLESAFSRYLNGMISDLLYVKGKSILVDDNTWNLLYSTTLHELLPDAIFVHVIRDPRDVISSLISQRWAPSDVGSCARFYKYLMDNMEHKLSMVRPESVLMIRYEDIVFNRAEAVKSLSDKLQLRLSDLKGFHQFNFKRDSIGRYRRDLSGGDLEILDSVIPDYISKYGSS
jgi:hypothetical protein